ncbi:hypothetical protein LIER_22592 [Lithospermum erythrorhizon]|uniref:Reverse transcriptase Ty1/copia-type domain-containing protein n=1 Tax=Lithospermum erythrorhizon TaxID=34254 RepID=A0AAV3QXJ3_LITER
MGWALVERVGVDMYELGKGTCQIESRGDPIDMGTLAEEAGGVMCGSTEGGCKWVFHIKLNTYGTIERYKAHLVTQGYKQQHGLDFDQTLSLVIKPATIHVVLTLAVTRQWEVRQLDVKNGKLSEFVREKVALGDLTVLHVPTHKQLVDDFTKPLSTSKFHFAISNMCLSIPAQLEGGCKPNKSLSLASSAQQCHTKDHETNSPQ